ncbi:MAG: leucine-rich repeat domain-containing protein [Fimbriimonadales bacterium]
MIIGRRYRVVLVAVLLAAITTLACGQGTPAHAASLEATVLDADAVAVATLVDYTLNHDVTTIVDATFSTGEVLKGDLPKTLKIPVYRRFPTFVAWIVGKSRMLLAGSGGRYTVILLSDPHLLVMRSDFTVLRDARIVIRAAKQTIGAALGVTKIETMQVSVPYAIAKPFPQTDMGGHPRPYMRPPMWLDVPIDARLEHWAVAESRSRDDLRRQDVATALGYFKSDRNIAILKAMLHDRASLNRVEPNGNLGHGRRHCYVRQAAYASLQRLGVSVEPPVIDEDSFQPDAVTFVRLEIAGNVSQTLQGLAQFKNLTELHLSQSSVCDADLETIASLPGIKLLDLSRTAITDAGLAAIGRMKALSHLDLADTKITEAGLPNLAGLRSLDYLDLGGTSISDNGLKEIAKLRTLRWLGLGLTKVTPQGLLALKPLRDLGEIELPPLPWELADEWFRALHDAGLLHAYNKVYAKGDKRATSDDEAVLASLYTEPVTDASLKQFSVFRNLQRLMLPNSQFFSGKITDGAMKTVAGFEHLTELVVNGTQVTDAGIQELKNLHSLKRLALADSRITDAGLRVLANFANLDTLILSGTQVTDGGLSALRGLKSLKLLILTDTEVTDAGMQVLLDLPALETVWLPKGVTDRGLFELAKLPSLRSVYLSDVPKVTFEGLVKLRRLRPDIQI